MEEEEERERRRKRRRRRRRKRRRSANVLTRGRRRSRWVVRCGIVPIRKLASCEALVLLNNLLTRRQHQCYKHTLRADTTNMINQTLTQLASC